MKSVSSMIPVVLLILLPHGLQQAANSSVEASASNETDRDALLAFKASISNQQGAIASWNTTNALCSWQGISCSLKHSHRVIVLNLSSEGLSGTIVPSIENLTFLQTLDLSMNNLHGEIPPGVGRLSRLRYLDLSNNSFHGEVNANLKNCTRLESINLDSNMLTGEVPAWLGGLSSLRILNLKNKFSGAIPRSLANLSALQEMWFTSNQLESTIPEGLGKLSGLEALGLGANHLSGTIPSTLFNLSSVTHFSVALNELHGILPSDLGNRLPKLQKLFLGVNNFTGSLPASLANATDMYSLDIFINNFTGIVPPEIGKLCPQRIYLSSNQFVATTPRDWEFMTFLANCTRLSILELQSNMLCGMLPNSVTNLSAQLQELYVGFNELYGAIPFGISNLVGLTVLQFSNNQFSGVLPDSIGRLNSLQVLGFENNPLTGIMPSSLGNLTQLLRLYAYNNMFEGSLPRSLGNLQKITEAEFSNNRFTDPLPTEIFHISSMSYVLDLSHNYFFGPLPPDVGSLTNLAYLDVSGNNLSGPLPDALSNCLSLTELRLDSNAFDGSILVSISKMKGLISLNLTKNTLSGEIPREIGLMSGLKELYLSHNNLSGHIPESFENMTSLYQLDLSFNNLNGKVPSHGVFSNMTGFKFDGNQGFCGGISELHLPPCLSESMKHNNKRFRLLIEVIVPVVGIVLCFTLVLISISLLRKKKKCRSTVLEGLDFTKDKHPRVSYAELVRGTNGFDTNNLIGKGRYGSVYKCSLLLKNTMTTVAVKVFDLQESGSSRSFIAECEVLNKIRHRNLISAITCCSGSDSNQNDFKAIVFEFMPNGSLHSWLHPVNASTQQQGLTLMQRLNIAVDVADAIDYLHNNCEPPIVHCDLKPSNIILDQVLVAHVGDFGLAKKISDSQSVNSNSTFGIRGTIGYVAPEYGEGGLVSPCGDVYSFGIVILELFTGMTPTHDMFGDGLTLQNEAC
ncbi:unnamed protein product [Urochloa decumbens]|uniref:Receptor kinase-like protein Xa21 n=1 Tax=Urochloa decumbens TaxID=240449 RepID=A0ABC8W2G7_9POAL